RDTRTNAVLGTSTVDLAAGSAVTVQAPWVPAAPDTHQIEVQVSSYVLDESDYANNSAVLNVILGTQLSVDPGSLPTSVRFDAPYPNPSSLGVVFTFTLPHAASGAIEIYDLLGRRVRSWRWSSLQPGVHTVEWDGRGSTDERLPTGLYLCRLEAGGE